MYFCTVGIRTAACFLPHVLNEFQGGGAGYPLIFTANASEAVWPGNYQRTVAREHAERGISKHAGRMYVPHFSIRGVSSYAKPGGIQSELKKKKKEEEEVSGKCSGKPAHGSVLNTLCWVTLTDEKRSTFIWALQAALLALKARSAFFLWSG